MACRTVLPFLLVLLTSSFAEGQQTFGQRAKAGVSRDRSNLDLKLPPLRISMCTFENSALRRLQVQRLKTAEEILRIRATQWQHGLGRTIQPLRTALFRVIESRLELAATARERIQILQAGLRLAKRFELGAKIKREIGVGDFTTFPLATHMRLEFEIRVEKEKLKFRQCR